MKLFSFHPWCAVLFLYLLTAASFTHASIFATVHGLIHDLQHRPMQGAHVVLRSANSAWQRGALTDANGEFRCNGIPLGKYRLAAFQQGFAPEE